MDDLVSREAVKKWLERWDGYIDMDIVRRMQYRVIDIPSTQPDESTCWGCNCPKMDSLEQPTQTNADSMQWSALDCVRRQQAIDAVNAATVITNPEHFKGHEKFTGFMEDEDISSFGKWERANGFNTALVETRILLGKLPYAQPERKKGEWIRNDNGTYSCSVCQSWIPEQQHCYARYCLYCGADMRGESE